MSSTDLELHMRVAEYLAGRTSLRDFSGQVALLTWDMVATADAMEWSVYQVELWLAELSNGDRTEAELRDLLRPMAGVS